jgi:hypothetical protein
MVRSTCLCWLTNVAATKEALSHPETLRVLLSLAPLHSYNVETADEEEDEARAGVSEWLWTIIEAVAIQCKFQPPGLCSRQLRQTSHKAQTRRI